MEEEPRGNDQRREEAFGDCIQTLILEPNFKSSKATQAQLDKFKELQKRCLQIKQISKDNEKLKGMARRRGKVSKQDIANKATEGTCATDCKDEAIPAFASKKGQKLHWGLGVKERWERKANM